MKLRKTRHFNYNSEQDWGKKKKKNE